MARRLRTARRTDPLPRAAGMHRRKGLSIVDATAGLGRDAFALAHLGASLIAIERIPELAFLLHLASSESGNILDVIHGEAAPWLRQLAPELRPDVVYLDPMFAEAGRAQVKKEMQACRELAGAPVDASDLLVTAREVARDRVVVKRHPHHEPLAADVSHTVGSERVRFDVYLTKATEP
ncbi:MAG: class I SAM-dependent methyltransferase [Planctomycetota bacterium]